MRSHQNNYSNNRNRYNLGPFFFVVVLSLVMAFAVAILLRQWFEKTRLYEQVALEHVELSHERDELLVQLEELDAAFRDLMEGHDQLKELYIEKINEIEQLRSQLSRDKGNVEKYKNRISELETELSEYQQQVDVLKAENRELSGENAQIRDALNKTAGEKELLEEKYQDIQKKVEEASGLSLSSIEVLAMRETRRGDKPVSRARRTDKIQVCYTINKNEFASPGAKELFFQITSSDNQIIGFSPQKVVESGNNQINYSFKQSVEFQNQEKFTCAQWVYDDFSKGKYNLQIIHEGNLIGSSSFELK